MFIEKIYNTGLVLTIDNKLVFYTWSKTNNCKRNITKKHRTGQNYFLYKINNSDKKL